jgi:propionate CoA-transferase
LLLYREYDKFINITQNAKKIVFCGTFSTKELEEDVENGKLVIAKEGKIKKFLKNTEHITFSADYARKTNKEVLYITERCVFMLGDKGLILKEIAPGIDVDGDILLQMEFKPEIAEDLHEMDTRIFKDEKMDLKKEVSIKERLLIRS